MQLFFRGAARAADQKSRDIRYLFRVSTDGRAFSRNSCRFAGACNGFGGKLHFLWSF
jgi:hypothetical protein